MKIEWRKPPKKFGAARDALGMIDTFGMAETFMEAFKHYTTRNSIPKKAEKFAEKYAGDNERKENALRHAYWQAMLTYKHGEEKAEDMGDWHERLDNDPDDSRVDQHNNAIGRWIGRTVRDMEANAKSLPKDWDPEKEIEKMVLEALKNDELIHWHVPVGENPSLLNPN